MNYRPPMTGIDDRRTAGTPHDLEFLGELRPEQKQALQAIDSIEQGILVAPPGAGKTVIACATMAHHGVSTLILDDRKALADQWRKRIHELMGEKPGQIGGGRSKTAGRIDVALLPTLARRDNVAELTAGNGFVIADECRHVPAAAFSHVMNQMPAKL